MLGKLGKQIRLGQMALGLGLLAVAASQVVGQGVGPEISRQIPSGEGTLAGSGGVPSTELAAGFVAAKSAGAPTLGAAGDMIGFSSSDASGTQTITLVHTGKPWMAVYHIDRSGQIRLVSSRPLDADFSLQLNATSPLPEEIRKLDRR